jgi:hypothetical protein
MRLAGAFALIGAIVSSCAGDSEPRVASYVGGVTAGDAKIALVVDEEAGRFVLYVCGGDATYATHTRWFAGEIADATIEANKDGWSIAGDVWSDGAMGSLVDPSGNRIQWSAGIAGGTTISGLYDTMDEGCRTGVIVIDDGRGAPIVQGTWCNADGLREQVTPISPVALTDRGIEVAVEVAGVERRLFVTPVR